MAYKAKRMEQGKHAIRLEIYRGDKLVKSTVFNQSIIKVGTLSSSGLRLDEGDEVSRMHAVLEINSPSDICVVDLGSRHGTFLNDVKVNKANLKIGDELRFGDVRVVVAMLDKSEDDPEEESPPKREERMSFTECLDYAARNSVLVHFDGAIVWAWTEDTEETKGTKIKATSFRGAINTLRAYIEA